MMKKLMIKIKQLFCDHSLLEFIHKEEEKLNHYKSVWKCKKCGKEIMKYHK